MLDRYESCLTIADSCQSASPATTPKKRPYTQVFSTPVAHRSTKRLYSPGSPLSSKLVHAKVDSDIPYSQTPSLNEDIETAAPPNKIFIRNGVMTCWTQHWDQLHQLITDEMWTAEVLGIPLAEVQNAQMRTSISVCVSDTRLDFNRLGRAGEFDDFDMVKCAIRYLSNRHVVRLRRCLHNSPKAAISLDSEEEKALSAVDLVPPTPPASDTQSSECEEMVLLPIPSSACPWPASGVLAARQAISKSAIESVASPLKSADVPPGSNKRRSKRLQLQNRDD